MEYRYHDSNSDCTIRVIVKFIICMKIFVKQLIGHKNCKSHAHLLHTKPTIIILKSLSQEGSTNFMLFLM